MKQSTLRRMLVIVMCTSPLGLASAAGPLRQSSRGQIAGVVVDVTGVALPGVVVIAVRDPDGALNRTTTDGQGRYQFNTLAEGDSVADGTYHVDFELAGFDLVRRNNVQVRPGSTASANATLSLSVLCECVDRWGETPRPILSERPGQVVDSSGRPFPHAELEVVSPVGAEKAYADADGRFRVHLPATGTWPLTARRGAAAVTVQVSATGNSLLVLTLPRRETGPLPDVENLRQPCCPDLFIRRRP